MGIIEECRFFPVSTVTLWSCSSSFHDHWQSMLTCLTGFLHSWMPGCWSSWLQGGLVALELLCPPMLLDGIKIQVAFLLKVPSKILILKLYTWNIGFLMLFRDMIYEIGIWALSFKVSCSLRGTADSHSWPMNSQGFVLGIVTRPSGNSSETTVCEYQFRVLPEEYISKRQLRFSSFKSIWYQLRLRNWSFWMSSNLAAELGPLSVFCFHIQNACINAPLQVAKVVCFCTLSDKIFMSVDSFQVIW